MQRYALTYDSMQDGRKECFWVQDHELQKFATEAAFESLAEVSPGEVVRLANQEDDSFYSLHEVTWAFALDRENYATDDDDVGKLVCKLVTEKVSEEADEDE